MSDIPCRASFVSPGYPAYCLESIEPVFYGCLGYIDLSNVGGVPPNAIYHPQKGSIS
jgi:hypothetical protein